MAKFPVKYFDSQTFAGAPRCAGVAGDLIALLKACLIDGFNVMAVQSIAVAGGVATVEFGTIHGYIVGQIIKIDGATPTELNGDQYVVSVTSTALTFATTAIDGAASGAIGCRTAPVGDWEVRYSGTNKAVFRSTDIAGVRHNFRLYDVAATYAQIRGYKNMTSVDAGTNPFPSTTQVGGNGAYIYKSDYSGTTEVRPWLLIADARSVYLAVGWSSSYPAVFDLYTFGEAVAYKTGDVNLSLVHAAMDTQSDPGGNNPLVYFGGGTFSYAAMSHSGSGSSIGLYPVGSGLLGYSGIFGQSVYPSSITGGLTLHSPVVLIEGTEPRGHYPGLMQCLQNTPLTHGTIIEGGLGLEGKRTLLSSAAHYGQEARVAFDLTGPWR